METTSNREFIPFSKPLIGEEEIRAVTEVLKSGWITTGPKCVEFEEMFKKYIGTTNAIAVNSCTGALHSALLGLGIKKGDEVITSTFTFASTAHAIKYTEAIPVFVDIREETLNINPKLIEENITPKTKAIIVVHYGGQPCEMDEINEIAKRHGLFVIEDAAHAIGAEYKCRKVGTLGDVGCFSFYANKNMTTGEGGMITTGNAELAPIMRCYSYLGIEKNAWERNHKKGKWVYEVTRLGYKYNMSDINASIGIEQLKKVDSFNKERRKYAEYYSEKLKGLRGVILPTEIKEVTSSWHLYPVRIIQRETGVSRDQIIDLLKERNIGTSVHFIPLHHHPYYKAENQNKKFPVADTVFESIISLPLFPSMTMDEINYVIKTLKEVLEEARTGVANK